MTRTHLFRGLAVAAAAAGLIFTIFPAVQAQGVVSEWKSVQPPPPPALKTVTINPRTTALLVMDFNDSTCAKGGARYRPRCAKAIPKVKHLLDEARARHMLVIFTGYPHMPPIVKQLIPRPGEQKVVAGADKFEGTNLNKILKEHGITTVIATGTAPNGAVLFTAFGAAAHGYKVIVPVDTMPGDSAYAEQSSIWGIAHDPGMGNKSTLTSAGKIAF